ncbi:MAG: hypothetical protein L0I84_05740 [Halomonas subglaciescola]|nr:hypothetical protein [Halomonas subglaciescola]
MQFTKPSIGDRVSQLGYLVKNTFTIVGRDKDILVPVVKMSLYASLVVVLFFGGIAAVIIGRGGTAAWMFLFSIILFVYKFFFYNRLELRLSRLVFDTACGKDATVKAAKAELTGMKRQVFILGLVDMLRAWITRQQDGSKGFMSLLLGALGELGDLVTHFLLPVFAIDKLGVKDGCMRLGVLKDHVPETLGGVFGVDIMGGVLRTIMSPLYLIAGIIGVLAGLFFGDFLPAAFSAGPLGDLFSTIPAWLPVDTATVFSWFPLFVLIFLSCIGNAIFARLVATIKVIYFTLFYARIAHAEKLTPDLRQALDGYLQVEASDDSESAAQLQDS